MKSLYLIVPFAPLVGAIIAGFFGWLIGPKNTHRITILGMVISFAAACLVLLDVLKGNTFNGPLYTWITTAGITTAGITTAGITTAGITTAGITTAGITTAGITTAGITTGGITTAGTTAGGSAFQIGFLIDSLSALMMVVVTFVSLAVHVYTIGYMHGDPGYQRFFSYISLFTFSMLMLVMANNFLQLFFGWEAVGLMSYLLIGFWYTRESAIFANLKAFLVNRVGDFGFLLAIALVFMYMGSLDYAQVFRAAPEMADRTIQLVPGWQWSLMTVICILLFIGAMGKSAQVPLHVWLPDSMEGPTPISALIHAATMVTAGIFMVARMSPLYDLSTTALSVVLIVGGLNAFFLGLLGVVMNDIKRVVAYSTLSQLGYMAVALGASAYAVGIFHLVTHAFFKALLFLAAGSVIIAMHHEQDMRRMGGLRKYMPITYWTAVVGSLALCGIPPFAGFFSKDSIIEAVHLSSTPGAGFAYLTVLSGVFVTSLYTFRMLFMTFHGKERFEVHDGGHHGHGDVGHAAGDHSEHGEEHSGPPRESPWVVTLPLVMLAIPSVYAGWAYIEPLLFGGFFDGAIVVDPAHDPLARLKEEFHGPAAFALHGLTSAPFWVALAGIATAWYLYIKRPELPEVLAQRLRGLYTALVNKYYFDDVYQLVFAGGARRLGNALWKIGDVTIIDGFFVNGSARAVGWFAGVIRRVQSGFVYHYAFMMIIGVFVLLTLWLARTA